MNMAEDSKAKSSTKEKKTKKEKPPALEDKPFTEFIEQHFVPELEKALGEASWDSVDVTFDKGQLAVQGANSSEAYWQVKGVRPGSDQRFNVVFTKEDIKGPKFFYYTLGDAPSSTVEQFMGDERRVTLDLMVLYTLQRLNGQKWLTRN
jgi:hypothetical protein